MEPFIIDTRIIYVLVKLYLRLLIYLVLFLLYSHTLIRL